MSLAIVPSSAPAGGSTLVYRTTTWTLLARPNLYLPRPGSTTVREWTSQPKLLLLIQIYRSLEAAIGLNLTRFVLRRVSPVPTLSQAKRET